jgi:hypothetical protein
MTLPRWLAAPGPDDHVKLLPCVAVGPDVFVKLADYQRLAEEHKRLRDAVAPLLDRDVVQPFISAWEFDPHRSDVDGEEIHTRLQEAMGE